MLASLWWQSGLDVGDQKLNVASLGLLEDWPLDWGSLQYKPDLWHIEFDQSQLQGHVV